MGVLPRMNSTTVPLPEWTSWPLPARAAWRRGSGGGRDGEGCGDGVRPVGVALPSITSRNLWIVSIPSATSGGPRYRTPLGIVAGPGRREVRQVDRRGRATSDAVRNAAEPPGPQHGVEGAVGGTSPWYFPFLVTEMRRVSMSSGASSLAEVIVAGRPRATGVRPPSGPGRVPGARATQPADLRKLRRPAPPPFGHSCVAFLGGVPTAAAPAGGVGRGRFLRRTPPPARRPDYFRRGARAWLRSGP